MDINEIYQLALWVQREISGTNLPNQYQELIQKINRMAQPGEQRVSFEPELSNLLDKLGEVKLSQLSHEQIKALEVFDFPSYVGEPGKLYIRKILTDSTHDLASIVNNLSNAHVQILATVNKFNEIQNSLSMIVSPEVSPATNMALIRVTFKNNASIENLPELEQWSKEWNLIIRGFAMAEGKAPGSVKIVGVSNGSIILTLASSVGLAKVIVKIMHDLVDLAEKIIRLKQYADEIRQSNTTKSLEIADDLVASIEEDRRKGVEQIIINIENLNINHTTTPTGDITAALKNSTERLLDFIEKGGDVDVIPPEITFNDDNSVNADATEVDQINQLRDATQKLREMDYKTKLLEFSQAAKGS